MVFHVHRAVLFHSSHIFETIFDKGDGRTDAASVPPLKIEANADALELLLTFAYPNKSSPYIRELNTLGAVFRAAKRYEMESVLHQLRKTLLEIGMIDEKFIPPLYAAVPLATLTLCYAFDGSVEGRFALRECLKGNLEEYVKGAADFDIPGPLLSAVLRLRRERMEWFKSKLATIP